MAHDKALSISEPRQRNIRTTRRRWCRNHQRDIFADQLDTLTSRAHLRFRCARRRRPSIQPTRTVRDTRRHTKIKFQSQIRARPTKKIRPNNRINLRRVGTRAHIARLFIRSETSHRRTYLRCDTRVGVRDLPRLHHVQFIDETRRDSTKCLRVVQRHHATPAVS